MLALIIDIAITSFVVTVLCMTKLLSCYFQPVCVLMFKSVLLCKHFILWSCSFSQSQNLVFLIRVFRLLIFGLITDMVAFFGIFFFCHFFPSFLYVLLFLPSFGSVKYFLLYSLFY